MCATFRHRNKILSALLTGLFAISGCGLNESPIEPDHGAPSSAAHVSDKGLIAAKLASLTGGITVSKLVSAAGDSLVFLDENGPGAADDIYVHLDIPAGAVSLPVTISMTVYGDSLSQMVADFAPDGLLFLLDAELRFELGNDLVDMDADDIEVLHEHSDGTSEWAEISSINEYTNSTQVNVVAPGFSRYGVWRGR